MWDPEQAIEDRLASQMVSQVLTPGSRILVPHCADGEFGQYLKAKHGGVVIGLEPDPCLAAQARARLDATIEIEPDAISPGWAPASFDAVVWRNGFDRVADPGRMLQQIREWLTSSGTLLLYVANARRQTVVRSLLNGSWQECFAGSRAIRFFTRREIEKLLARAGFEICELHLVPAGGCAHGLRQGPRDAVIVDGLQIGGLSHEAVEEFSASGFLVSAVPAEQPVFGLTSIILVTHNQVHFTRNCVDSIRQFTDEPFELIFVDNGSTDRTGNYLESLLDAKVIVNEQNRGFPAAVNQGLTVAAGQQILLLNNDVIVTTGWLRRMLFVLLSDPRIGLVGPCSNNVSGPQQVPVTYEDLTQLDGFAWEWGKRNRGRTIDVDRLVGFCLLISREVIERIGSLDERFGIGCFEDDDYCRRAVNAGFRAVIACESFVHHFGGQTFRASGVDVGSLLRENQKKYEAKWNRDNQIARREPDANGMAPPTRIQFGIERAEGGGLLLRTKAVRLSLCMIVRDNEGTIEQSLRSIRPWVDEMIIVDTGSKDRTPQVAQALGACVFRFPWCDDFSAARNESLKHSCGEWIFWMDSDDTIDCENGSKLRELTDSPHDPNIMGYVIQVHCPSANADGVNDVTVVDHVKLFRNRRGVEFEGRIHEQVLASIRRKGGDVFFTDVHVVHSLVDLGPEARRRKLERDLRILNIEIAEKPDHPFVLFNLGMTYSDAEEHEMAVAHLRRCLEVSDPNESHVRKAYALLVNEYCRVGQLEIAWEECKRGLGIYPQDKELLFRSGMLHHQFGRLNDSERAYQSVLSDSAPRHFASIDAGVTGYKCRNNLAIVYTDMGLTDRAEQQWRILVTDYPLYRPGWRGLANALIERRAYDEAERVSERLKKDRSLQSIGYVLSARLLERRGLYREACQQLKTALTDDPGDVESLQEFCRLLFESGSLEEAESALRQLVEAAPTDAASFHNLGVVYLRMGRHPDACRALRRSLELRPACPLTCLHLGESLEASGDLEGAISVWREGLGSTPNHLQLAAALQRVGAYSAGANGER